VLQKFEAEDVKSYSNCLTSRRFFADTEGMRMLKSYILLGVVSMMVFISAALAKDVEQTLVLSPDDVSFEIVKGSYTEAIFTNRPRLNIKLKSGNVFPVYLGKAASLLESQKDRLESLARDGKKKGQMIVLRIANEQAQLWAVSNMKNDRVIPAKVCVSELQALETKLYSNSPNVYSGSAKKEIREIIERIDQLNDHSGSAQ